MVYIKQRTLSTLQEDSSLFAPQPADKFLRIHDEVGNKLLDIYKIGCHLTGRNLRSPEEIYKPVRELDPALYLLVEFILLQQETGESESSPAVLVGVSRTNPLTGTADLSLLEFR